MFQQIKYTMQNNIWCIVYRLSYFLTAQQACCLYAVSKTVFEMKATSHWIMLSTVYCQNPVTFCVHTQYFSWQRNTCQNVLTDEKLRVQLATSSKPSLEYIISYLMGI